MSMIFSSGQMVACVRQLTHKHHCVSIGHQGTKGLRPLLLYRLDTSKMDG